MGGGVALIVKDQICQGIKFIRGGTNVICTRLKKEYFNIEQDIYLGVVYISPINSSYGQRIEYNPFEVVCQDISNFMDKGRVILMADFNARTGNMSDLVASDGCERVTLLIDIPSDDGISSRRSQDDSGRVCEYEKRLVDMCISSRLKIANGRVIGGTSGRYTCHKYNRSSLVDYVLANDAMISQMRYLHVNDLHKHLTDHCMVSFGIIVKVSIQINIPKANKTKMQGRFKWYEGADQLTLDNLTQDKTTQTLLNSKISNIDDSVTELTNIISTAASKCRTRVKYAKHCTKKVKHKK